MKRFLSILAVLYALIISGCKDGKIEQPEDNSTEDTDAISVTAKLSASANSVLTDFAWTSQDVLSVVTKASDGSAGTLLISGSGGKFRGILPDGYAIGAYAFYPAWDGNAASPCYLELLPDGKKVNIRLRESISPDQNHPLRAIPLCGELSGGETTLDIAVGVLKITVEYIPSSVRALCLEAPSGTPLSGVFSLSESGKVLASAAVTSSPRKSISFTPEKEAETRDFYIPLPEGVIPAGTKVYLLTGAGALDLVTMSKANTLKAGVVTDTEKLTWKDPSDEPGPDVPGPDDPGPDDPENPEGSHTGNLDNPKYYDWEW